MNKIIKLVFSMFLFLLLGFSHQTVARAEDSGEHVDVIVPGNIGIVFLEDGTTSISEFTVSNRTYSAMKISNVNVTEYNDWKLVSGDEVILKDTKQISFEMEQYDLAGGANVVDITIPDKESKTIQIQVRRGAWTYSSEPEKALELEIAYSFGEKNEAYAIYSATDKSLTFVRSRTPIMAGEIYDEKMVTTVYTGFEDAEYTSYSQVPWIYAGGNLGGNIKNVIVRDDIRPISTAYWFFCVRDCEYFDLSGLNGTRLQNMNAMFSSAGESVMTKVTIIGLAQLDTSKVQSMYCTFRGTGMNAKEFALDDIGGWDTSQVTDMRLMFYQTGQYADWHLDLSRWNVGKVTDYSGFKAYAEKQVVSPQW